MDEVLWSGVHARALGKKKDITVTILAILKNVYNIKWCYNAACQGFHQLLFPLLSTIFQPIG